MPHASTKRNGNLAERARRNNSAPAHPLKQNSAPIAARMGVLSDLVDGLMNPKILDFYFVSSTTGERVGTSRFVIACRSTVLEELLVDVDEPIKELTLPYSGATLKAAVEYLFTNELEESPLSRDEDADTIRGLVQLSHFGQVHGVIGLYELAFRMIRMIVNKVPALALALFDEVDHYEFYTRGLDVNPNASSKSFSKSSHDDDGMESYALQIIEDSPFEALQSPGNHGPGIQYLSLDRLEVLCRNKALQLEEIDFFHSLVKWCEVVLKWSQWSSYEEQNESSDSILHDEVYHEKRDRVKEIAKSVELRFIEPSELITTVKDSDLVDYTAILEAMADQALEAQLEGKEYSNYRGKHHIERVLVRDGGLEDINGIYLRQDREDYRDYEALYLKTSERRNGEYGLFVWNSVWNIAPLADLSNVCYTCTPLSHTDESQLLKPPAKGWVASHNGTLPAPNCRLLPVRSARRNQSIRASLPSCYRNSLEFLGN